MVRAPVGQFWVRDAAEVCGGDDVACPPRHADMLVGSGREAIPDASDRSEVQTRYSFIIKLLDRRSQS